MSAFKVGARVRITYCEAWPYLCGQEATITEYAEHESIIDPLPGRQYWELSPDIWGGVRAPVPSKEGCWLLACDERHMTPIQPDRNKTIPWSECLWSPPGQRKRGRKRRASLT
jgi:hypothetical protein